MAELKLKVEDFPQRTKLTSKEDHSLAVKCLQELGKDQILRVIKLVLEKNVGKGASSYTFAKEVYTKYSLFTILFASSVSDTKNVSTYTTPYTVVDKLVGAGHSMDPVPLKYEADDPFLRAYQELCKIECTDNGQKYKIPIKESYPDVPIKKLSRDVNARHVPLLLQFTDIVTLFFRVSKGKVVFNDAPQTYSSLIKAAYYYDKSYIFPFCTLLDEILLTDPSIAQRLLSLEGVKFADVFYANLLKWYAIKGNNFIFSEMLNNFMNGTGAKKNFVVRPIGSTAPTINYRSIIKPPSLLSQKVELDNVSMQQAHYALNVARELRGQDMSDRGASTRWIYIASNLGSLFADVCYTATNIAPLAVYPEIAFHTDGKPVNFMKYLNALKSLEYAGTVYVDSASTLLNSLKKHDTEKGEFTYKFAKYKIKSVIMARELIDKIHANKMVVLYLSKDQFSGVSITDVTYDEVVSNAVMHTLKSCVSIHPVVTFVKTCSVLNSDLCGDWSFKSTCEPHNCILMATNDMSMKWEPWRLDGKTQLADIHKASVLCNVARCLYPITKMHPYTLLKKQKIEPPILYTKLIGVMDHNQAMEEELSDRFSREYAELAKEEVLGEPRDKGKQKQDEGRAPVAERDEGEDFAAEEEEEQDSSENEDEDDVLDASDEEPLEAK